jgi:4'-phosphopantetheinyl transferase EntD
MLAAIVPSGVVVAEVFDDRFDSCVLFPEEAAAVQRAAPKRKREFAAVRACARQALAGAGFGPGPIVPGPSGAPVWPGGAVGSMTHCDGYRGCAIGRAETVSAIGIDAEPHEVLPDGVLAMVAGDRERAELARLAATAPGLCWERILFSAKESVFKAWFPATGRFLGFRDAEIALEESGIFRAQLLVAEPETGHPRAYDGRWLVAHGLIVTAVVVPAALPTGPPDRLPAPFMGLGADIVRLNGFCAPRNVREVGGCSAQPMARRLRPTGG